MARITFTGEATFEATRKAEAWCEERGLSVAPSDRMHMRGILRGDYLIAKWHNLTKKEISQLDGVLHDCREGPAYIDIKDDVLALVEAEVKARELATSESGQGS